MVRCDSPGTGPASPAAWLDAEPSARTRRDILARYSRHALDRDLRSGAVVRLLPDTYVGRRHATVFDTRAAAALLWAGPGVAIGGLSAVHLHGVVASVPERIDLCAPRRRISEDRTGSAPFSQGDAAITSPFAGLPAFPSRTL